MPVDLANVTAWFTRRRKFKGLSIKNKKSSIKGKDDIVPAYLETINSESEISELDLSRKNHYRKRREESDSTLIETEIESSETEREIEEVRVVRTETPKNKNPNPLSKPKKFRRKLGRFFGIVSYDNYQKLKALLDQYEEQLIKENKISREELLKGNLKSNGISRFSFCSSCNPSAPCQECLQSQVDASEETARKARNQKDLLQKKVAELDAENKKLKEQNQVLQSRPNPVSILHTETVDEEEINKFKAQRDQAINQKTQAEKELKTTTDELNASLQELEKIKRQLNLILNEWRFGDAPLKSAQEFLDEFKPWVNQQLEKKKELKKFLNNHGLNDLGEIRTVNGLTDEEQEQKVKHLQTELKLQQEEHLGYRYETEYEIAQLSDLLGELTDKKKKLRNSSWKKISFLKTRIEKLEEEAETRKNTIQQKEKEIKKLKNQKKQVKQQKRKRDREIDKLKARLVEQTTNLQQLENKRQGEIIRLRNKNKTLGDHLRNESDRWQAKEADWETTQTKLVKKIADLALELTNEKIKNKNLTTDKNNFQTRAQDLHCQLETRTKQRDRARKKLTEIKEDYQALVQSSQANLTSLALVKYELESNEEDTSELAQSLTKNTSLLVGEIIKLTKHTCPPCNLRHCWHSDYDQLKLHVCPPVCSDFDHQLIRNNREKEIVGQINTDCQLGCSSDSNLGQIINKIKELISPPGVDLALVIQLEKESMQKLLSPTLFAAYDEKLKQVDNYQDLATQRSDILQELLNQEKQQLTAPKKGGWITPQTIFLGGLVLMLTVGGLLVLKRNKNIPSKSGPGKGNAPAKLPTLQQISKYLKDNQIKSLEVNEWGELVTKLKG